MQHLPIWFIGNCVPDMIDAANAEFLALPTKDATMGIAGEEQDHSSRNTTVRFAEKGHWFGQMMVEFGKLANKQCGWDYEVDDHEAPQIASYGVGQHYGWHVDTFPLSGQPTDRKITVVCLMSDPDEFEAGELQIRLRSDFTPPLAKGAIIAFPSILEHRVIPVTSGLRTSATVWLSGPRFR